VSATDKHNYADGPYLGWSGNPNQLPGEYAALLRDAVGHLIDISVALHSISYELQQIRHALAKDSPAP
jgi:hypothetical protein